MLHIGVVNDRGLAQVSFTLGAFFGKNMGCVGVGSFDFARFRCSETFFCATVRFDFWHFYSSNI